MTKWQYKTIQVTPAGMLGGQVNVKKAEVLLDEAGRDGWELVTVHTPIRAHGDSTELILFLKRPTP